MGTPKRGVIPQPLREGPGFDYWAPVPVKGALTGFFVSGETPDVHPPITALPTGRAARRRWRKVISCVPPTEGRGLIEQKVDPGPELVRRDLPELHCAAEFAKLRRGRQRLPPKETRMQILRRTARLRTEPE